MEILDDEAIKDKWVEIEHKMGFSGVTVEDYEDWYFHHDKPLVELAHRNCLRQVVEWGEEDCPHKTFRWKQNCWVCWQELTKETEDKDNG